MFQQDVERIEQLAAQQTAPAPAKESVMGKVWSHAAVAIIAGLLGVAGGSRSVGNAPPALKPTEPVSVAPEAAVKPLTYAEASAKAAKDGVPLVVGVQVAPPKGAWVSCRIESWGPEALKQGWKDTPQIVPSKAGAPIGIMSPTSTAEDVSKALAAPPVVARPVIVGGDVCLGGRCTSGKGRGG